MRFSVISLKILLMLLVLQTGCTLNTRISQLNLLSAADPNFDVNPNPSPEEKPLFVFDTLTDHTKPKDVIVKYAGDCFSDGQVISYTLGNLSGSATCASKRFEISVNISALTQKPAAIQIDSTHEGKTLQKTVLLDLQPWLFPPAHSQIIDYVQWAGDRLLVWSNNPSPALFVYTPSTNQWTTATPPPLSARNGSSYVWTGTQLIIWGGSSGSTYFNDGAVYTLATNTWSIMTLSNAPTPRMDAGGVWTGSKMMIYGGYDNSWRSSAALYDPALNQWTTLPSGSVTRRWPNMVVVGTDVYVSGGGNLSMYRYSLVSNTWSGALSMTNGPTTTWFPIHHVSSGNKLIVTGAGGGSVSAQQKLYDIGTNTWADISTVNAPSSRRHHDSGFSDVLGKLFVWGGNTLMNDLGDGGIYDYGTNTWTPIPVSSDSPSARSVYGVGFWGDHNFYIAKPYNELLIFNSKLF